MPHPAVIAGCVVGGVAAAIAFEVAIFKPWREQQAEADWARFKSEFDEHVKEFRRQPFFGGGRARRGDSDAEFQMHQENLREIEEFEMANRQREKMEQEAKEEIDRSFHSCPDEPEQHASLRRRRAQESASDDEKLGNAPFVQRHSPGQSFSSRSSHRDDQMIFDAEQEASSPHHALGDATPSTLPDSPAWPVRSPPTSSAVLVDAQDGESSPLAPRSPPSLQPKPHAYRPENLSQSDLRASGHAVWAAPFSASSAGSASRLGSERQASGDRMSDLMQQSQTWSTFGGNDDEDEDLHTVSQMSSPGVRSISPFSEIQSGGWSEVEGISSPDGFSDLELASASSQRNHLEDESDSDDDQIVLGGSGSAADSGLLIENWRP